MSPSLSPGQTAAQKLADFICALDHSHIRPEAVARCRELLLDQLGCQLVGASVPWNQPSIDSSKTPRAAARLAL